MSVEEQVKLYCQQMTEEKALHKSNEQIKGDFKKMLIENKEKSADSGRYHVNLVEKPSDTFDEVKLLALLKKYWDEMGGKGNCPWIATKEFVNEDALESSIYKGDLPDTLLKEISKCRVHSVTYALTFKVDKE